ncbi:Hypothetical protein PYTT_0911 [Akkermansia glycaniphila]|uniref:Uncharacterized protein n=1 Tax=Akkermansia glycaniphila TaxID=1679444 RepID=A0A1H6KY83_9BACT|nr:Hypothetical protein PYTT_0911 [Akkermansia glycaniphila]
MQIAFRLPFLTIRHPNLSRNKCGNCRKKGKSGEFHQFGTSGKVNSSQPHQKTSPQLRRRNASSTLLPHLKRPLNPRNLRHRPILQHNLHDIEPERHLILQKKQPVARTLPEQLPLRRIHSPGRRPVIRPRTGLHLHKQQHIPLPANQIHLPAPAHPEIRPQHLHPAAAQPRSRQQLAETADPGRRPPISPAITQTAAPSVQQAQTSGDDEP